MQRCWIGILAGGWLAASAGVLSVAAERRTALAGFGDSVIAFALPQ